jgi:hypothetical protein
LENNKEALRKAGLGVCAISYDSREVLKAFAERSQITFPLLSDPNSKIIRAFGILNTTIPPDELSYGAPFPGTYLVNEKGVVAAKFFEEDFRDRYSVGTILTREFGSPLNTRQTTLDQDHLSMRYYPSTDRAFPGSRISLVVEIQLKDKVHLYALGVQGYLPLKWTSKPSVGLTFHSVTYPESKVLYLPVIKEQVPIFEGRIRLVQDVTIANPPILLRELGSGNELGIEGTLQYQACDDKMCYLPQTVPLRWVIKIQNLDRQRVPEPLRRENQAKPQPDSRSRDKR